MAIAFVTSVAAKSTNTNGFTTGTCDTTGANLLAAMQTYYAQATVGAITDSKGNSWSNLTAYAGALNACRISHSTPTVVGAGHTFSVSGSGNYPTLAVLAFSGAKASSPFDVENGAGGTSSSAQSGSITPSENGEVVIASIGWNTNGTPISSINGGFTLQHNQAPVTTQCIGGAAAYLIQTSAAAANPTWTLAITDPWEASIASFKAAAAGASVIKTFLALANASTKTVNALANASVKTFDGVANA